MRSMTAAYFIDSAKAHGHRPRLHMLCYHLGMRNLEIAFIFNQIADLLEIQGANPFRVRAYRRAAINIEGLADNIETLALSDGTLRNIPGIGEDLAEQDRRVYPHRRRFNFTRT